MPYHFISDFILKIDTDKSTHTLAAIHFPLQLGLAIGAPTG